MKDSHEPLKHGIDAITAFFTLGAILNWIPAIAGLVSIVWYSIRIWESETVKILVGRKSKDA